MRRTLFAIALLLGCGRGLHPEAPARSPEGILELARSRPVPARVQAKVQLSITGKGVGGGTNGYLLADRPGRGHLAVLGLLGGPVLTLSTDGTGVAVDLPREKRHLVAASASAVLTDLSGGSASPDDLVAALLGDLPFDGIEPKSKRKLDNGAIAVVLQSPLGWDASAWLTTDGTLQEMTLERDGKALMDLQYEPYAPVELDGAEVLLPTTLRVVLPRAGVALEIRYKSWKIPDPLPPVFGLEPPDGETSESLDDFARTLGLAALLQAATAP